MKPRGGGNNCGKLTKPREPDRVLIDRHATSVCSPPERMGGDRLRRTMHPLIIRFPLPSPWGEKSRGGLSRVHVRISKVNSLYGYICVCVCVSLMQMFAYSASRTRYVGRVIVVTSDALESRLTGTLVQHTTASRRIDGEFALPRTNSPRFEWRYDTKRRRSRHVVCAIFRHIPTLARTITRGERGRTNSLRFAIS